MRGSRDQPPAAPGQRGEPGRDPSREPIADLIRALEDLGLRPESRELAGALWLAGCIDRVSPGWSALDAGDAQAKSKAERAGPGEVGEGPSAAGDDKDVGRPSGEPTRAADESRRVDETLAFPLTARTAMGAVAASTVSVPDRSHLPQALHLGRAWRMLRRPRPSRRERELDLDATVERLAEQRLNRQGLWDLVYRARPIPRLDLTLVVDRGPSMAVWEPQIDELIVLLRRIGAFATLRIRHLESGVEGPRLLESERPVPEEAIGRPMPGAEPGHMLTLVLSDAISAAWYAPATYRMLARLGRDGLAVLVQLLPANRWIDTALGVGDELRLGIVQVRDPKLPKMAPLAADGTAAAGAADACALPVISQTPWGVRALVAVLRGGGPEARLIGYRLDGLQSALAAASPYGMDLPPEEQLERFLSVASPAARRLAGYLSRLPYPLTVRMMLLVQRAMQPVDDLSPLAEVFSGGLLELHRPAGPDSPKSYRLVGQGIQRSDTGPVVRALGNLVSRDEAWTVLCTVTQELGRSGQHPAADWPLLIEDAAAGAAFRLPEGLARGDAWDRAFALIAVDVARRRGGLYRRGGERLAEAIAGLAVPQPRVEGPVSTPPLPTAPTPFRDRFTDGSGDGPEMVWLPGGTFQMGSPEGVGHDSEHPAHDVTLGHYGVGKYPVTVGEFRRFVEATGYVTDAERGGGAYVRDKGEWVERKDASWRNPYMAQDDRHPVVCITWNDAKAYCDWLSKETDRSYGVLTEAQWEHACRAGGDGAYCFGDDEVLLDDYAWYAGNARDGTRPVGGKAANDWGLCDMHGNCWEWCEDWYGTYSGQAQQDPSGPEWGSDRVVRGGSWGSVAGDCRSAYRGGDEPSVRGLYLGFRLSRTGPRDSYPFTLGPARLAPVPEPIPGLRDPLPDGGQGPAMVWLPGGVFTMGQDDSPYEDEKPAHRVRVAAFSIGQYPVTFEEYDRFCAATKRKPPHDEGWGRGSRPVISVSWEDAQAYCDWLSKETGEAYRLATEAEWEYACRAGTDFRWGFGDDEAKLGDHAWYAANAAGKAHPVGRKRPNAWHLHDMHGNVWEWCRDWYADDTYRRRAGSAERTGRAEAASSAAREPASENPSGPESGSNRAFRGGSWLDGAGGCRSAFRSGRPPSSRYDDLGFRLSRTGPWRSHPITLGPARAAEEARADEGGAQAGETVPRARRRWSAQETFRDRFRIVRADGTAEQVDAPELVYLPGGTFPMGDEQGLDREKPVHPVRLDAFAIGRTPVTWGDYRRFCEATGTHWPEWLESGSQYHLETGSDDHYRRCGIAAKALDLPVVGISWEDAAAYCAWLSTQTGERYALPTEAQWEYACRAGTRSRWSCGDDEGALGDHAWYDANAGGKVHPVAGKRPNDWGLYDMHGNCWEWCADWFREDYYQQLVKAAEQSQSSARRFASWLRPSASRREQSPSENPSGPESGSIRVLRGGSWLDDADDCRSAYRSLWHPSNRIDFVGFRLSRTV